MHDIKAIRERSDLLHAGLVKRGTSSEEARATIDDILKLDADLRALLTELQQKQARRNAASKDIGQAKAKKDENKAQELMLEVASLKDAIQQGEERERELKVKLDQILAGIPNLPADDVPVGRDEDDNVEVKSRAFGHRPAMNSAREHFDLGEALGMMDFERAAKVSGSRFVYLTRGLARLERALASFMLDLHTDNFGYAEVNPPVLVHNIAMIGTGQLPKFFDDQFISMPGFDALNEYAKGFAKTVAEGLLNQHGGLSWSDSGAHDKIDQVIATHDPKRTGRALEELENAYWLIPTAEVPLTNYINGEIVDEDKLPFRFTAHTPCFRAEAGAAGKDTRGMIRMHQFSKVELVSITTPEQSNAEHERMTDCAQEVLKRLGLHHRVVTLCTGDMGFAAKKTYDIEVWLPGQNRFREISSCSNCGDFQARRMNARYRGKDGKVAGFVHTLNGSGLAVGRTLIAIMENYQEPDGSIRIPDALLPYMGGVKKIEKVA